MTGNTFTPAGGQSSDTADLRITSVLVDPATNEPMICFRWKGENHHPLDHQAYKLALAGKYGLTLDHAEIFKKHGVKCRTSNELEPWPLGDYDTTTQDAELAPAAAPAEALVRAETTSPAEGHPKWMDTMHSRIENPDSMDDPAAPEIQWPEGGGIPITGRTFTEERAHELGIVYTDNKDRAHVSIHEAARYIMQHIAFARVRFDPSSKYIELRYYDRGKYYDQAREVIERAAERLLGSYSSNQRVSEILGKITRTFPAREPDDNNGERWISVKNGYLNTETLELEPHHPGRVFTIQTPTEFHPEAPKEPVKRFLWQIMSPMEFNPRAIPSDDMLALEEMIGYCLMPGYPFQWFFILLGEGQNGKGVLINLIAELLGQDNISAVPLQDLDTGRDKFAAADMRGALANLCGDLSATELRNTGIVKKACGDDWIRAQQKGMDAFKFKNRAKMIFACNELPYTKDESRGFARRPRVFMFDQIFTSTTRVKANPNILKELTTPENMSGLLNVALDGLARLCKNKALTGREDEEFEIERFQNMQDTAGKFLNDHCVIDQAFVLDGRMNRAHKTGRKELYAAYQAWCEAKGYPDVRDRDFNKRVIEIFGEVVREGRWGEENPDEPNARVWVGLRFDPPD